MGFSIGKKIANKKDAKLDGRRGSNRCSACPESSTLPLNHKKELLCGWDVARPRGLEGSAGAREQSVLK